MGLSRTLFLNKVLSSPRPGKAEPAHHPSVLPASWLCGAQGTARVQERPSLLSRAPGMAMSCAQEWRKPEGTEVNKGNY